MEYKVLKGRSANKLKDNNCIAFLCQLDFNLARVYLLSDWSYLVMPFNPISSGVVTSKQELLHKWIKERYFPVNEEDDTLYFERSRRLRNLNSCKEGLKEALCEFIFMDNMQSPADLSAEQIDCIYEILRHRNMFQKFRLNFTVLLGDYIISQRKDLKLSWGLLSDRQYLNPMMNLVLVTDKKRQRYYELEKHLNIKQGYPGIRYYLKAVVFESKNQVDDMVELIGVM